MNENGDTTTRAPRIIPRSDHPISRADISENALKVLYRLQRAGHQAFLVGGAVRDLLLGVRPKDFDVATDAHPQEVRRLFRNSRLIGRRFRLAHVLFGRDVIEVATFRGKDNDGESVPGEIVHDSEGRILRDNVYGSIDEDVWRRDFTANGLYYNIGDYSVWDYVGGFDDAQGRVLRLIGNPQARYREDPVRMLRAVRFAAKLGFSIESDTEIPIKRHAALLASVPPARLLEECLKLFLKGAGADSLEMLRQHSLFRWLFPQTDRLLAGPALDIITEALRNTDARVGEGQPVSPVFLFAVLLWEPVRRRAAALRSAGEGPIEAFQHAASEVLAEQQSSVAIPRRLATPIHDILVMQERFTRRVGKRVLSVLNHPRFRAAYDLLMLRVAAGEAPGELGRWWTDIQTMSPDEVRRAIRPPKRRRSRRRQEQEDA